MTKKLNYWLRVSPFVLVLCLAAGALGLTGCPTEPDDTDNLIGTWTNVWHPDEEDEYITTVIITDKTVVYQGSYEGTIANEPDFEAASGVFIIKFTKYATDYDGNPVTTHANVGKYGALYWRDLTSSSVFMADAYTSYTHTLVDTLPNATAAFTEDKVGDYIDWSMVGAYTK
jgi:hypothetical protein